MNLILNKDAVGDRYIFRVASAKETSVVVSLDVIEAVLRRKPAGVRISPVDLE
jgi:hypothetical protein